VPWFAGTGGCRRSGSDPQRQLALAGRPAGTLCQAADHRHRWLLGDGTGARLTRASQRAIEAEHYPVLRRTRRRVRRTTHTGAVVVVLPVLARGAAAFGASIRPAAAHSTGAYPAHWYGTSPRLTSLRWRVGFT
jgi:hypothetical protein